MSGFHCTPCQRGEHKQCTLECSCVCPEPLSGRVGEDPFSGKCLPRPLPHPLEAYYKAISGEGPLALDWKDKPHRLVYDLIMAMRHAQSSPEISPEVHRLSAWLQDREASYRGVAASCPNHSPDIRQAMHIRANECRDIFLHLGCEVLDEMDRREQRTNGGGRGE